MKNNKVIYALVLAVLTGACKQDVIDLKTTPVIEDTSCTNATKGTADFSKFVAIGSGYVAGFQAGALFTAGQNNSLPAIMNIAFQCVGAPATFNQPTINSTLGYNLFVSPNPDADNKIAGRFLLQGASPKPTAQLYALGDLSAAPNPSINPGFMFTGDKTKLQNFGVEAITLGQFLIPNTGNWADANPAHGFSPFYARFASNPGTSTIIGDAAAAGGSFFLFYAGMDDFMLYAAYGGDSKAAPLTAVDAFTARYSAAINALLGSNPNLKGVVGNFPDFFVAPHFTSVPYNPIPLDAATATAVGTGFAGYNAALDGLIANAAAFGISDALKAQIATRKINFAAGAGNAILITDQSLTDLGPYFDGLKNVGAINADQRAALTPYQLVRQTTPTDVLPLGAGGVIGTVVGGNPAAIYGVSVPLPDRYVITPVERDSINTARTGYNNAIKAVVDQSGGRLAFADVAAAESSLVTNQAGVVNGVTITPNINPPTGIYSEDGLDLNSRGYAFLANVFIDAINAKFTATIPHVNVANYSATALPIP